MLGEFHRVFVAVLLTAATCFPALAGDPADLAKQVEIRRTEFGVPHILGETPEAAAFGFAWVQCEDHFPIVIKGIARGRGEMARIYGSKSDVEFDFMMRLFRARERAIETFHLLTPEYRSILRGYAAGINAYIAQHPEEAESWMAPVTAHDIAAAGQIAVMRFTFNRGGIIQSYLKKQKKDVEEVEADDEEQGTGSNTFALAPSRTKSGKAILLNNPHQPWNEQANYYEAHITVPGVYNFYGSTFVGGPILSTGFNDSLGWAHTVNYPDLEELYELTLDPENPGHYLFDGGSVPITSEEAVVETKDGKTEARTHYYTPLGPIIHQSDTTITVLKSVGYTQFQSGEQWYAMGKAKSLEEFRECLDMQAIAMFNIGYADKDGNIMYVWNGTVPDIPLQNTKDDAVPVSSSDDVWTRIHPMSELPVIVNPPGGYIQNSNSPFYLTNLQAPLKREDFPDHFPENRLIPRSQHGLMLLDNDQQFSLEELIELKHSQRVIIAERFVPQLVAILEQSKPDDQMTAGIEVVKNWDMTSNAESQGGVLFQFWWMLYLKDENLDTLFAEKWSEDDPLNTPTGLTKPEKVVGAFKMAMGAVAKKYGRLDVPWGDVFRIRRGEVDLPAEGSIDEVGSYRILKFKEEEDGTYTANSGDSYVFLVEFGDLPRAYSILAYSECGREDSPHYDDQTALFARHEMKQVAFTEADIAAKLERSYRPGE